VDGSFDKWRAVRGIVVLVVDLAPASRSFFDG
jgi:hypothetical protein